MINHPKLLNIFIGIYIKLSKRSECVKNVGLKWCAQQKICLLGKVYC